MLPLCNTEIKQKHTGTLTNSKLIISEAPDSDLAGYPANLRTEYLIYGKAGYRLSGRIFG
jgi:hypothetical protein